MCDAGALLLLLFKRRYKVRFNCTNYHFIVVILDSRRAKAAYMHKVLA